MNEKQLAVLRDNYSKINGIDPCGDSYKNLIAFLDRQPVNVLRTLAEARIKFISPLATNRVRQAMSRG